MQKYHTIKIGACSGAFVCILLLCLSMYFTPNFVADNLSKDGILEQSTIFQINFIRLGFIILSTIGLLISVLFIMKPDLFYLLQSKISKVPLIIKLLLSADSVRKIREALKQSEAGNNTKNFDLYLGVSKRAITRLLILIVFLLQLANAFAVCLQNSDSRTFLVNFFIKVFYVGSEGKIPTWYSACALLFCALLLSVISFFKRKSRDPYYLHWVGLATVFALMSLDEATEMHEEIGVFLHRTFDTTGIFYYAWVIPGIAFVLIFGAIYLKFTLNLQKRTKYLFIVACLIYLAGVLGLEMIGSYHWSINKFSLTYNIIATIEEFLEMSGIVVFIYALLDYIEVYLPSKEIRLRFIK
jgi:hypothetical protein